MVERLGQPQLGGVKRCPYCGIANPQLPVKWHANAAIPRADGGPVSMWAAYACTTCGSVIVAQGEPGAGVSNPEIVQVVPPPRQVHEDLPDRARVYLDQAYSSLNAPDAAAMVAGSAVDAMLKELGFKEGSLYARIDEAKAAGVLTEPMAAWAHSVRLGANNPRHADDIDPHTTVEQAKLSVDFAEALGFFLFVLPARVRRGIEAAKQAG